MNEEEVLGKKGGDFLETKLQKKFFKLNCKL